MLLSIKQLKEILAWFKEPGPELRDFDKPLLYRVIGNLLVCMFALTVIAVDNVALGLTMRFVFFITLFQIFGYAVLSIKRSQENFTNRKALEQDD